MTERKKNIRPIVRLSEGLKQLEQAILSSPAQEEVLKKLLKVVRSDFNKVCPDDTKDEWPHCSIEGIHFQRLVETLNDWIWRVDEFGVYTYVSPQVKNLLGYEPGEVLGKTPFDFMPEEEAKRVRKIFKEIVKNQKPFNALENTNRTRNGDLIVLETSGVPIFDNEGCFRGYQGVDRDISLRVKIKEELQTSKNKLQNILETSTDVIWEMNLAGQHTYSNHKLEDLLGYQPEETEGIEFFHFLHPDDQKEVKEVLPKLISEKKGWNGWVLRWRHKNGEYRYWESNAKPVFNELNEVIGFCGVDRDITQRKVMEDNYRLFTGLTSDYVHYCTRAGRSNFKVKWIGGAINPISGYRVEEVLDLGCFLPLVHPDDQQRVSDYLLSLVPGDRKTIEFRILTQHQEIRWVSEKSQCKAGTSEAELILLGAVTDITERKQAEERLRESEEGFRNIAEMLPEVVFELDLNGKLKFANRKAYEIFGYSEEAFLRGLNAFDMIVPEERDIAKVRISQRLAGEEVGAKEYTALRKDGSTFPVILNAIPIIKNLEPVGIIGIMTDITDRKSYEMALLAATQVAEAASQAKDLFLAKVSHEIRTPLTTIVGFGELLEDADLTPKQKEYLAAINTSSKTLGSLIDDVLDLAKVTAGRLILRPKDFSLHNLINKLVASQAHKIKEKNLPININIDTDVPDLLIGDSLRMQQVLLNLLGNAIKFTQKGEISIAATVLEKTGIRVLLDIAIKDTGIGISANMLEHIFEPFTQILDSSLPNLGGSGLGLTISRSLADLMGGSLRVESQEGVGSTFHLIVPLQRKKGNLSDNLLTERKSSLWNGPDLNILLAEDDPVNAELIKTFLKNMGHAVSIVENGKDALGSLKSKTFDVALMDIQMPVMNGTEVLNVIREQEKMTGKHLIMIALTANALVGDKEKYLKMGFDGYLSKPFRTNELIDEMARVVPT